MLPNSQTITISQLLFDVWAFALTLLKRREHSKAGQIQTSLLSTFYRDGVMYYVAIIGGFNPKPKNVLLTFIIPTVVKIFCLISVYLAYWYPPSEVRPFFNDSAEQEL